ncbi:MAG: AAA family ATPase, partial [Proteobacteria bacterium]|nr:AAA family ATPase [Pseudomonadota bacterium]
MAIGFVKSRYVSRSSNGHACNSSAYNSRSKILSLKDGVVFNYSKQGGNVFHEVLLPDYVNRKFKDISNLANEVESCEKRKDSQLYVEWVLALPKEEEVTLEMKKEIALKFIEYKGWIKEGLGVQLDIHEPDEDEANWHAHLLVTTRRFRKDVLGFELLKASDLQPKVVNRRVVEETQDHIAYTNIQNECFKEYGLDLKVDLPGEITQEHIGPVRMRSVMNAAILRNEERMRANKENLASGGDLLRYVSKHKSVFSKNDLMRATKIISDKEKRETLVADALKNQSLIVLHEEDGAENGYYTTKEIRQEEYKILRLSGYVAQESNVLLKGSYKQMATATAMLEEAKQSSQLTQEQYEALSHVLFTRSGVRILRGRAGTGKSHVLGKVATIAEAAGLNVIGLASTHKARTELAARGYANNDTVKGMLFKHYNGRFKIPKGSLIVLDEAGMIGNDDYQELLRVVAANKCNIILAGDERQLSSVQRGGMFEIFDREYGSALITNIQRQKAQWGRDVATAMSRGEIRSGVKVLHEQGKMIEHEDKQSSMQGLIEDWSKSDKRVEDRLIIAISNKDVAALNHGVRQYLKLAGKLTGDEIRVGAHYYQKGDRILITETNKELGLTNGDYAQVVEATADKFVISRGSNDSSGDMVSSSGSDNKAQEGKRELIEFNPKYYGGFKHGYATTVFKAQGASISDVYVYHAGYGWMRNSYVALSRCIDEMKLYVNKESTKSIDQLVRQLGNNTYEGSSLIYQTKEDIAAKETKAHEDTANESSKGILGSIWKGFDKVAEAIGTRVVKWADKSLALDEYYQYEKLEIKQHIVEEVLAEVYEEVVAKEGYQEQKVAVGAVEVGGNSGKVRLFGSNNTGVNKSITESKVINVSNTKVALTPKEKFYANRVRLKQNEINRQQRKDEWNRDQERLRSEVRYKVEDIARDLLGPENKRLSQKNSLRWGEHGKLAMHIRGERAGIWCDFSSGKGGDIFDLVQDIRKSDFKAAVEYLEAAVGFKKSTNPNLKLVYDHNNSDVFAKALKHREEEARENKQKQELVIKLYDRSKELEDKSIAYRYLKNVRGIDCRLGKDIRTAGIYVREQADIET